MEIFTDYHIAIIRYNALLFKLILLSIHTTDASNMLYTRMPYGAEYVDSPLSSRQIHVQRMG